MVIFVVQEPSTPSPPPAQHPPVGPVGLKIFAITPQCLYVLHIWYAHNLWAVRLNYITAKSEQLKLHKINLAENPYSKQTMKLSKLQADSELRWRVWCAEHCLCISDDCSPLFRQGKVLFYVRWWGIFWAGVTALCLIRSGWFRLGCYLKTERWATFLSTLLAAAYAWSETGWGETPEDEEKM